MTKTPAGLYIHIPFCVKKCPYCDFYSISDLSMVDTFVQALLKEIEITQNAALSFDSIYIGGGTPSVLRAQHISKILETIHRRFNIHASPEITIEVNPGTIDLEKLNCYKTFGVNRINIGVQSFHDSHLTFLGRIHDADTACSVLNRARQAGFDNIGLDLIYGLPDQTEDVWAVDLQTAVGFKPEHLSCYMLTYEKDTDMWRKLKNKSFRPLPDQASAELFEFTMAFLENNGFTQYEISNFAKSSSKNRQTYFSRHNQKYWSFAPYLGFGPSAHSLIQPKRYWNVRSVKKYIDRLSDGKRSVDKEEVLTEEQMIIEAVYLGFRKTDGIDIHTFDATFDTSFIRRFEEVISDLSEKEMLYIDKKTCRLTRKGMVFLDSIAKMFVEKIP